MVDYNKPTLLQKNEPCPNSYGNQGWTHRKQDVMDIVDIDPLTGGFSGESVKPPCGAFI